MNHSQPHRPVGNRADFASCYRPSKWAEDVACQTLCNSESLYAVAYGFSQEKDTDPALYQSTETHGKRPDLLVYEKDVHRRLVCKYGKKIMESLDTTPDKNIPTECLNLALCAIEIEWSKGDGRTMASCAQIKKKASQDKYQGIELVKGSTEFVTYLKGPDLKLLKQWQVVGQTPIFICQFYSDGYNRLFDLSRLDSDIRSQDGIVSQERVKYSAKEKMMTRYKIPFTLGIDFATCTEAPLSGAERIAKDNGRVDIIETVKGGQFALADVAQKLLLGEMTINKIGTQSSPLRATTELDRLIMSKWIKKGGTTGPEIYAKMKTFDQKSVQSALENAVNEGTLKRLQTSGFTQYARAE